MQAATFYNSVHVRAHTQGYLHLVNVKTLKCRNILIMKQG